MNGGVRLAGEVERTPSLAICTTELAEATREWDRAFARWWTYTADDMADIARRWWHARRDLRDAVMGEGQ